MPVPPASSGPDRAARGAAWSLGLLLAINLFNYIDRYILAAVVSPVSKEFFPAERSENADAWMGVLATVFLVSYMLTAPVFGWLGDRWRRWAIVGIGVILWSLASGGSGLAPTFWVLLATRALVGIGEGAYGPIAPSLLADLYPIERRARILSYFYLAIPVGSALGFVIGGQLASIGGWRLPFYAVVAPGILLGVLCFLRPEPARSAGGLGSPTRKLHPSDYLILARTPSFVLNTIGYTASTFAIGGVSYWMPKYVSEYRGAGELARVNLVFGGITVAAGLGATLLGGVLADKLRPRLPGSYFLVAAGGMLLGFPLFLAVLWTPFPAAWVLMFLAVFCLFVNIGPTTTIPANVTHPAMRSSAYAITILVIHLFGDAISPVIIGAVTDATKSASNPIGNMNAGFLVVSAAILVAGIAWLAGIKHLERDTAAAPTRLPP
jgi:MFS family permease